MRRSPPVPRDNIEAWPWRTVSIEEAVIAKLRELPEDKQLEVLDFASFLATKPNGPLKSSYGLWKDLGISISEEDIAEARKEMWGGFPKEQSSE